MTLCEFLHNNWEILAKPYFEKEKCPKTINLQKIVSMGQICDLSSWSLQMGRWQQKLKSTKFAA